MFVIKHFHWIISINVVRAIVGIETNVKNALIPRARLTERASMVLLRKCSHHKKEMRS